MREITGVRAVVQLGRLARAQRGIKLRRPLPRLYVRGALAAATHAGEIAEELRVKGVGRATLPGGATAEDNGISVAFDVALDDDLRREGRVLDLIHSVNAMRRAADIELTASS